MCVKCYEENKIGIATQIPWVALTSVMRFPKWWVTTEKVPDKVPSFLNLNESCFPGKFSAYYYNSTKNYIHM